MHCPSWFHCLVSAIRKSNASVVEDMLTLREAGLKIFMCNSVPTKGSSLSSTQSNAKQNKMKQITSAGLLSLRSEPNAPEYLTTDHTKCSSHQAENSDKGAKKLVYEGARHKHKSNNLICFPSPMI